MIDNDSVIPKITVALEISIKKNRKYVVVLLLKLVKKIFQNTTRLKNSTFWFQMTIVSITNHRWLKIFFVVKILFVLILIRINSNYRRVKFISIVHDSYNWGELLFQSLIKIFDQYNPLQLPSKHFKNRRVTFFCKLAKIYPTTVTSNRNKFSSSITIK